MEATVAKKRIEVNSKAEAWAIIDEIFPTDYIKDEARSSSAGYPVYSSTAEGHYYDYICDLNDRYEVNLSNGKTVNVWFSEIYMKAKELAHENMSLRQEVEDLQSDLEVEKFLNGIYEEKLKNLSKENDEMKAQLEAYEKLNAEMAEKLRVIRTVLD